MLNDNLTDYQKAKLKRFYEEWIKPVENVLVEPHKSRWEEIVNKYALKE